MEDLIWDLALLNFTHTKKFYHRSTRRLEGYSTGSPLLVNINNGRRSIFPGEATISMPDRVARGSARNAQGVGVIVITLPRLPHRAL